MKRKGLSSIFAALLLLLLAFGLFFASYYIEYSEYNYELVSNTVPASLNIGVNYHNSWLNVSNGGSQVVSVNDVLLLSGGSLVVLNYSAVVYSGQNVSIFLPVSAQRYGVETNRGVEWANAT
jgi:hypothetical protein